MVGLAHSLGKRVDGGRRRDRSEQLDFLRDRGCDAAQGFLFARPGPATGVAALSEAAAA